MSETPRTLADDPDEVILLLNDPDSVGRALPLCIATECIEKLQRELAQAQARCAEAEKELAELHEEWKSDILATSDLKKDAARYRFLRDKVIADAYRSDLDAAIDAALKEPR